MSKKVVWRIIALVSVLLLSLTLFGVPNAKVSAASAKGSDVVRGNVNVSDAAVRSYWTPARLQSARSLDTAPAHANTPQVVPSAIGPAVSRPPSAPASVRKATPAVSPQIVRRPLATALPYPYAYPESTVGKVFFTDPRTGGNFVCSATAVTSNNLSTVDTAGHCVANGGQSYFYTNWVFCAQYFYGCPNGYLWSARALWTHSNWLTNGWLAYDYGEAVLSPNANGNVVSFLGGAGWAYNEPYNQFYYAFGYPAAPPFDGGRLWYCASAFVAFDNPSPGPTTLSINCDMTGGSSGGGWMITLSGVFGYVNGHNDYKYNNDPAHMYSPYYGADWFAVFNAAQNS